MGPTQAMGAFLRTWRAEWAGLSRAQLALAVSRHCPKRRGVTAAVIRVWEAGQVPVTSAELAALCSVMEQRGLLPLELDDFRQHVFGACVEGQYPELFPGDETIHRPDIDQLARLLYTPGYMPGGYAVVWLVSVLRELRQAVGAEPPRPCAPAQSQRQQDALCVLLTVTGHWHNRCGRHALAARVFGEAVEATERFLGVDANLGGYPTLTWLMQRLSQLESQRTALRQLHGAHQPLVLGDTNPALQAPSRALLELSEQAEACGDHLTAAWAFLAGADPFDLGRPTFDEHRHTFDRLIAEAGSVCSPTYVYRRVHRVLLREGRLGKAERYVPGFEKLSRRDGLALCGWLEALGETALAAGDYAAAYEHFTHGVEVARRGQQGWYTVSFERVAGACERMLQHN